MEERKIELVNKVMELLSVGKTMPQTTHLIYTSEFSSEDKKQMFDILMSVGNYRIPKIKTSNYDDKPYTIMFIKDFLAFLTNPNNNLTKNELMTLMTIFLKIEEANSISNVLMNINQSAIAKKLGIDPRNMSYVMKGLQEKGIIKKNDGSLYINYNYFFKGSKAQYDNYKKVFDGINGNERNADYEGFNNYEEELFEMGN